MTDRKFTAGRWFWDDGILWAKAGIVPTQEVLRGRCSDGDDEYVDVSDEDAALIASAPKLLEACEKALDTLSSIRNKSKSYAPVTRTLEQIIAKAKGESGDYMENVS